MPDVERDRIGSGRSAPLLYQKPELELELGLFSLSVCVRVLSS